MTRISELIKMRKSAGEAYAATVDALMNQIVKLAAIDDALTSAKAQKLGAPWPVASFGGRGSWQDLETILEHAEHRPRRQRRLADEVHAQTAQLVESLAPAAA